MQSTGILEDTLDVGDAFWHSLLMSLQTVHSVNFPLIRIIDMLVLRDGEALD